MNLLGTIEARLLKIHIKERQKDENFKEAVIRGLTSCCCFRAGARSCSHNTRLEERVLEKRVWPWQVNPQQTFGKTGVVTVQLKTGFTLKGNH